MGKVIKIDFGKKRSLKEEDRKKQSRPKGAGEGKIYQLKIILADTDPQIWRRILVSGDVNLGKLHRIIQAVMGWTDTHLHEFHIKGISYADPEMEMTESKNERRTRLGKAVPEQGITFMYVYDFGDCWEHLIKVEKITDRHEKYNGVPVCLEGRLAGPPEDCGGVPGYYDLLRILKDPKAPDYKEMTEWIDPCFDPEEFDLEGLNEFLKILR